MFHWICPECGREIAPQATECAACDASATAPEPKGEPKLEPEQQPAPSTQKLLPPPPEPAPAPLQARIYGAPKAPAIAASKPLNPAGREISPVPTLAVAARTPLWRDALPELEPARAPRIAKAALREPQAATLSAKVQPPRDLTAASEPTPLPASLPVLDRPAPPAPPLAGSVNYAAIVASRVKAAAGKTAPAASSVKEQISLPGPTLPHELTSLQAAGIAKILVAGDAQAAPAKGSSWMLSLVVAAAVIAATLGATFYAMPGFANSSAPAPKASVEKPKAPPVPEQPPIPANPLARIVEVTGIRFVTDLPGRPPEIHYLVVNHSNVPLMGVTVNVTLRAVNASDGSPLSQFAFRAPKLGPYESKEMVSSIERFNRSLSLPEWRDLKAEIQIAQ